MKRQVFLCLSVFALFFLNCLIILTRLVKQKFDWFNQEMLQMNDFGNSIRKLREDKQLTLKTVAIELQIDIAILSKIERGQRKATREQVL
jgi:ribosome-binding protein aMBF1 (putative translation factor)